MICFADVDHRCEGDTTSQSFQVEAEILESYSVEEQMWLECRMVQSMTNSRLHGEIGVKCVKNLQIQLLFINNMKAKRICMHGFITSTAAGNYRFINTRTM